MGSDKTTHTLLPCPVCFQPTDSVKQYRYVKWCVFFFAGAVWQAVVHRACPGCMRQFVWRRCLFTAVPAHLLWLMGLLPWALCLIAASYRPGHSRAVVRGVTPEMAVAREMAQRELSWARVLSVLSVLLFWLPVIGLVVGALAFWLNRESGRWTRRASQVGLTASVLVHAALGVLFVIEQKRW
jgi:beta-lactamase regulating signal transducer with metallopeptidase domain